MAFIGANQKIMNVGAANNMADLARMQPTTIAVYDTFDLFGLSATANTTINFFQDVNSKRFPFANIARNAFTDGKSVAVMQFYMLVFTKTAGANPITRIQTLDEIDGFKALGKAELTLTVSNQVVIDRYPVAGSIGPWNRDAEFSTVATSKTAGTDSTGAIINYRSKAVKIFPAQPIILPNQEFVAQVQVPPCAPAGAADTVYAQLVLEGFGTLFTPDSPI